MGNEIENGRKTAPPKRHENVHQITKPKLDVFSATCITNNVEQTERKKLFFLNNINKFPWLSLNRIVCLTKVNETG